ncbi:MAG: hypothetical protein K2Y37_06740 [Pirellulales bacterium]|nr:hypothetical protein [Pirellulales bacterium]
MTLDFDPADLDVVDGAEPVTLERVGPGGTTSVAVAGALRGPRERHPPTTSGGVSLEPESIVWHLPSSALGEFEPRAGDTLIAGAESFVIVAAARVTLGTRWRVVTQTLRG